VTDKIQAMLYGADLPPVGVRVSVYFVGQRLLVDNMSLEIHSQRLTVSVGGFEHDELFLNWRDETGQQWALKALDKESIALVIKTAPDTVQAQLGQWHQRNSHIKAVWLGLSAVVLLLVILIGVLVWQYDNAVSWVAEQIPVSTEEKLGQAALEQIKSDSTLIESGLAVERIATIGARLTQGSRYQYQWFIKQDNTVNAFALSSGIVVVHSALLEKAENADELAAVLAHEVQHIEQRHSLKHMINSVGWAAVLTVILGDASAITAVLAHQVGTSYFSRDLETEADKLGYETLVKANIKPDGMASFLQKLADLSGDSKEGVAWISSHPETQARVDAIKQLLKDQPCNACQSLAIDWQLVQNALPKVEAAK